MELNPFERLVLRLTDDGARGRLVEYGPSGAQVQLADGSFLLVLHSGRGDLPRVQGLVAQVASKRGKARIVAVGGDAELTRWIESEGGKTVLLQYDRDGSLLAGLGGLAGKELMVAAARMAEPVVMPDFPAEMRARVQAAQAEAREVGHFVASLRARTPWMTWLLLGTIVAVFILQGLLVVQGESALLLTGALQSDPDFRLQIWRTLSYSWLHGSPMHIAFNGYALYLLGTFLERLVGSARFVVIYTASVFAGAMAVLMFQGGVGATVGASGGVWGLMTAMAVLFFRPQGIVPEAMVAPMRRSFGMVLVLNIAFSFLPGISFWGHAGGGIAGAALMFSGLVAWGLPKAETRVDPNSQVGPAAVAWAGTAITALVLLFASLMLTMWLAVRLVG